jgi:hypothetical protein
MSANPDAPQDETEAKPSAKSCPVCGVSMADRDPLGHSYLHFPSEPIPTRPDTLGARKLQAQLLGKREPEE